MRFWIIVLLAVLMPLQLSWAATGRYCQHETDITSKHIGHHTHQHGVNEPAEVGGDFVKKISVDMDCGTCHTGCSMAILEQDVIQTVNLTLHIAQRPLARSSQAHKDRPDRPQWNALV